MVEHPLRMREVPGSIPGFSKTKSFNFATMVNTFYSFLSSFHILFPRVVWQDVLHKIAVLHLLCILLALQQRFLWFTLYLQQPRRTKMSVDSDDVKKRRFANCHSLFTKVNGGL